MQFPGDVMHIHKSEATRLRKALTLFPGSSLFLSQGLTLQPPKSDWQLISPGHITLEPNIKVTRIKELITSTAFRKCTVNSMENMLTDVRTLRVKREDPVERPPRKECHNVAPTPSQELPERCCEQRGITLEIIGSVPPWTLISKLLTEHSLPGLSIKEKNIWIYHKCFSHVAWNVGLDSHQW